MLSKSKALYLVCKRWQVFSFFVVINLFIYLIYLFLAALGLRCCTQAFSTCGERELLFVAVRGLLIALASLVEEHRRVGFSSCGAWAQ